MTLTLLVLAALVCLSSAKFFHNVQKVQLNKEDPKAPVAPAQGFEGKDVAHEDQKTQTADWRREYGPKSGQVAVKSGAVTTTVVSVSLVTVSLGLAAILGLH